MIKISNLITRVLSFHYNSASVMEGLKQLIIMYDLDSILFKVGFSILIIMYFLSLILILVSISMLTIMSYSVCIFLFLGYIALCIIYSLVLFWGTVLLSVGLVLIIVYFLAFILDVENSRMLTGTLFLPYILLAVNSNMLYLMSYIDLIIFTVQHIILSIFMIISLNGWASNLWERHYLTPLGLIRRFAEVRIYLFKTSKDFRESLVVWWLIFLFLNASIIPVIEGLKWVIDVHIVFNGQILMNHYITLEMQEYIGAFNDICPDKLLMNIDDPRGPGPLDGPPVPPLVPPAPPAPLVPFSTWHYSHGTRIGWHTTEIQNLSNKASQIGLFSLSNINITEGTCTATFYQDVPSLDDTAKMDLLKQLLRFYPNGPDFKYTGTAPQTLHDPYRIQALVAKALDAWTMDQTTEFKSDQERKDISPYYHHDHREEYYVWAKDVANNMRRHRELHPEATMPKLDMYSQIFLTTFKNNHPNLTPYNYTHNKTISLLEKLRES